MKSLTERLEIDLKLGSTPDLDADERNQPIFCDGATERPREFEGLAPRSRWTPPAARQAVRAHQVAGPAVVVGSICGATSFVEVPGSLAELLRPVIAEMVSEELARLVGR